MRSAILCLALTACGPQYQVSPCGVMLDGSSDTFDTAACAAVATVAGYYGQERAQQAAKYAVVVVNPAALPDGIAGYTYCETGRIVLDRDDFYASALCHELFHASRCSDLQGDPEHSTWGSKDDPASAWQAVERFHALGRVQP